MHANSIFPSTFPNYSTISPKIVIYVTIFVLFSHYQMNWYIPPYVQTLLLSKILHLLSTLFNLSGINIMFLFMHIDKNTMSFWNETEMILHYRCYLSIDSDKSHWLMLLFNCLESWSVIDLVFEISRNKAIDFLIQEIFFTITKHSMRAMRAVNLKCQFW